jgi:Exonuclease VII small subunit
VNTPADIPFEEMLQKLEAVVRELEEGNLGLREALTRYEEGIGYLKKCYEGLTQAQRKIELLTGVDAEGRPLVQSFEEQEMSIQDKAESRSRRRSAVSKPPPAEGCAPEIDNRDTLF